MLVTDTIPKPEALRLLALELVLSHLLILVHFFQYVVTRMLILLNDAWVHNLFDALGWQVL